MIDDRFETFEASTGLIQKLCDRKFGIGADGLILIQSHPKLDYRMVYFNADGSQSLCGNGSRCGYAFAQSLGMAGPSATFETTDGIHQIKTEGDLIHFQLFDVSHIHQVSEKEWYLDTGSPHHIVLSEDVESINLQKEGHKIRASTAYTRQNGTNVNFAQLLPEEIKMRTYERGVEGETLSCGTGATAVGLLAGHLGYTSPVTLQTLGGKLQVSFVKKEHTFEEIWLAGPAKKVFEGSISI